MINEPRCAKCGMQFPSHYGCDRCGSKDVCEAQDYVPSGSLACSDAFAIEPVGSQRG
jgi:hypothetical protein